MTLLIAYGTIEGQTGKIARFVDELARAKGVETRLFDTADRTGEVSFRGVDKVILAASVHERRHPKPFEVFVGANASALKDRKTLLLSVSLSAAFPEGLDEARDYADEMKLRTGLDPDEELLVAGAVRTGRYDFYAMQVVRYVVLKDRDFDPGQSEHEFTDWDQLEKTVTKFLDNG